MYQETPLDEHRYLTDAVYHANRELVRALVEAEVLVPVEPDYEAAEEAFSERSTDSRSIVDAALRVGEETP